MFHPWHKLRALSQVQLSWVVMPGRLGETNGVDHIRMHPHQNQAQRRCTLAHELAHIELGHVHGCSLAEERTAGELAARWLIDIGELADAARWARSPEELADELWVDVETIHIRLGALSDAERARYLGVRKDVEVA
jgi:IrrE N-terminal-like domain